MQQEVAARLAAIRRQGIATHSAFQLQGLTSIAAPVFNRAGELELVLNTSGYGAGFDARPDGAFAEALRQTADQLSAELGYCPA